MPETEDPVLMNLNFSNEMKEKPIIRQSVQYATNVLRNATNVLRTEILRYGGIVPPITAEWSIVKDDLSNPVYSLKLLDYPSEANPVQRSFEHNFLVKQHEQLGEIMNRMLVDLLSRRARRQAGALNTVISGTSSIRVDQGG